MTLHPFTLASTFVFLAPAIGPLATIAFVLFLGAVVALTDRGAGDDAPSAPQL